MSTYPEYSLDTAITEFFTQTSATRSECDTKAGDLVGGAVIPVTVQGNCSYTVYAGPDSEFVVQFRLKSLMLELETATLAREIYGSLAPSVESFGELGESGDGEKEAVCGYVTNRIRGISYLDFELADDGPENSERNFVWRKTLMADVARYGSFLNIHNPHNSCVVLGCSGRHLPRKRMLIVPRFFALSWTAPQAGDSTYREKLRQTYTTELHLLLNSLPPRFHHLIQICLDSIDGVLSLPMVLLHSDFSTCNIMVDEVSCHLTGVIDWAEAEICPFGLNLHSLESITGTLHLRNGWRRYENYEALWDVFWGAFRDEVDDLSAETMETINMSRIMGLLLSRGFTRRLANMEPAVPIRDDETGRYNMMFLDGFLLDPATRFDDHNLA